MQRITAALTWGSGNRAAGPLFVDPDGLDNVPGTEDDRLDLRAGSPCIDAGDNTQVPAEVADGCDSASLRSAPSHPPLLLCYRQSVRLSLS